MRVSLDNFKSNFPEKAPTEGLNESEVTAFLNEVYAVDGFDGVVPPVYLDKDSPPEYIRAFKAQAKAIYKVGRDLGLTNLIDLQEKFKAVKAGEVPDDDFHQINEIKKSMERIVFQVKKDKDAGKSLDPKFKDYPFLCGEGTLTNLQSILAQLTLSSSSVDDALSLTKKEILEQYVTEFYRKKKDFLKKMEGMNTHPIYEVHHISSLLNAISDDYGLIKKTAQEDQYLTDINPDVRKCYAAL